MITPLFSVNADSRGVTQLHGGGFATGSPLEGGGDYAGLYARHHLGLLYLIGLATH